MKKSAFVVFVILNLATEFAQAAPTYQVTDLGVLGNGGSRPTAINNSGQVVGWSNVLRPSGSYVSQAFLYSSNSMTRLSPMLDNHSESQAINDRGEVVVFDPSQSFLSSAGNVTNLPTLRGQNVFPHDINNSGEIVGDAWTAPFPFTSSNTNPDRHAVLISGSNVRPIFDTSPLAVDTHSQ